MQLVQRVTKRVLDVAIAASVLVVGAPAIAAAAVLVYRDIGRPVLFRQHRVGKDGKIFELLKLRTMRDARDADGQPLPDAARLTATGKLLRASSLDELPQLINVLRGEMSLVGPRPLLIEYLPRYSATQARRHEVKPGITGLAQVEGRNALSWPEKLRLDVYYVDHAGLMFDLQILARTALALIRPRGISAAGEATMPVFQGEQ